MSAHIDGLNVALTNVTNLLVKDQANEVTTESPTAALQSTLTAQIGPAARDAVAASLGPAEADSIATKVVEHISQKLSA